MYYKLCEKQGNGAGQKCGGFGSSGSNFQKPTLYCKSEEQNCRFRLNGCNLCYLGNLRILGVECQESMLF